MNVLIEKELLVCKKIAELKTPFVRQRGVKVKVPSHEEFKNYLGTLFIKLKVGEKEFTDSRMLYPLYTNDKLFQRLMDIIAAGKIIQVLISLGGAAFLYVNHETFKEVVSMIEEANKRYNKAG